MIPLLFHLSHPLLPGYCGAETAYGIADYSPTRGALAAARRLVRSFKQDAHVLRKFAIRGMYLMGSAGTVAYTRDSDLDIWVCHAGDLAETAVATLQQKAVAIEAFALTQGVEVHFYVFDAERFSRGETLSLSGESSGSSQHFLLLDEFYRSGLLLAGLKPLWWHVPPEAENRYDAFVAEAIHARRITAGHYVDFGGIPEIPPAEFFGAALWQLYKSIESPYKSVMKLLLMESYAADYPKVRLLSHRYKEALGATDTRLDDLDPYLAMYSRLEDYLLSKQDTVRLEVLRRAFYLKVNEALSGPADPRQSPWRREVIARLVAAWGWTPLQIQTLDRRAEWRIDTAREERRALVKTLQKSYAVLSEFARTSGHTQHITAADLNALGRKLYAAFERKPHKIDLLTRGICQAPIEPALTLSHSTGTDTQIWLLYAGRLEPTELAGVPILKRSDSLLEILTWCHFNHLFDNQTEWHLFCDGQRQPLGEMRRLLEALTESFPGREPITTEMADLSRPPRITTAVFMLNIGCDVSPGGLAQGDVLTSSHNDAFQFGGTRTSLLGTVDLILETSWGELYVYRYVGQDALPRALCALAEGNPQALAVPPRVYCATADYGPQIRHRVETYLGDSLPFLLGANDAQARHHLVGVGETYHEVIRLARHAAFVVHRNALGLIKSLGEPSLHFRQVRFDPQGVERSPLAAVYQVNQPDRIQAFICLRAAKLDVYVLDEAGDLYVERQIGQTVRTTVNHFNRFFQGLRTVQANHPQGAMSPAAVEWYQLTETGSRGWQAQALSPGSAGLSHYVSLRVFADRNAAGQAEFTCYCEDQEFSSREHGGQLFKAIARHLLASRARQENYPVYITQLELSERYAVRHSGVARRTVRLLEFKKRIEYHLTKALRAELTDPPTPSPLPATA